MSDIKLTFKVNNIDPEGCRDLYIVYPDHVPHKITAQYVQVTNDDKYVLSYYEHGLEGEVPCFTELLFLNGEWSKSPFHKEYDDYEFVPYDEKLSKSIIEQLPEYLYFKIIVDGETKGDKYVITKKVEDEEPLENTGATVIQSKNNTYYMVLLTNGGENIVSKYPSNAIYRIDFPFPAYSLKGVSSHRLREMSNDDDINYGIDFNELEYVHQGLPVNVRRVIADYLENETPDNFDVTKLPVLEVNSKDSENYRIHFISCPCVEMFNEMYKSDKVYVDYDMKVSSFFYIDS